MSGVPTLSSPKALAQRLLVIKPSATLAIAEKAAQLAKSGVSVISFGVGEPDFSTPKHICEAAKAAIDSGGIKYTKVRGIAPLLQAIADDSQRRRGVRHEVGEIVVSVGAKHSLFNLALALFDPGDEIVIPSPYWVSYPEQARLMGAVPVIAETSDDDGFLLTAGKLEKALTKKTKAVVLCTPSNPTGAAYTRSEITAIADVLRKHDCYVIVDEIYSQLVYDHFEHVSLLSVAPDLKERLIIVDGASKTYAMTGWRIGWMLGPKHVADAVELIQGQSTTNPSAVAQHAAVAALTGDRNELARMIAEFGARRDVMVNGLRSIDGISCLTPQGAFYAFPSVKKFIGMKTSAGVVLQDDFMVAEYLLEDAHVAVVPGAAFGAPGYIRLSYATSREVIALGIERMKTSLAKLTA